MVSFICHFTAVQLGTSITTGKSRHCRFFSGQGFVDLTATRFPFCLGSPDTVALKGSTYFFDQGHWASREAVTRMSRVRRLTPPIMTNLVLNVSHNHIVLCVSHGFVSTKHTLSVLLEDVCVCV